MEHTKQAHNLQLGYIGRSRLSLFSPLLLPEAAQMIERGEPVTAVKNSDFAYEELERMHKLLQSNYTLVKYKK